MYRSYEFPLPWRSLIMNREFYCFANIKESVSDPNMLLQAMFHDFGLLPSLPKGISSNRSSAITRVDGVV